MDDYGPFDTYLTDHRLFTADCNYGALTNRLIRDKLVFVTKGNIQARLLRETDLTPDKAIKICKVEELTAAHGKELDKSKSLDKVKFKHLIKKITHLNRRS